MNSIHEEIRTIERADYPRLLEEALENASSVPDRLYIRGEMPPEDHVFLTIVGSRRYTEYGKAACEYLIAGLRGLPVVIVSGLAYGIDSIAHEAALKNGIHTMAVPGSGLSDEMIYPANHIGLARRILAAGGCLLSPFDETIMGNKWTFPYRNRIMAGIAQATLVIECEEDSGTMITARQAESFHRDVLIVPGSIFSKKSAGPHSYIKDGATPIISQEALIEALRLSATPRAKPDYKDLSADERKVITALFEPCTYDRLVEKLAMDATELNILISGLELKKILRKDGDRLRLAAD
ncbi:MAG TPA: DNA-protecting protein DprA [Candidatus Paceibacterota bacterium]|nr:DNA-protecting protein DprA [Candidatus Paceibacterota bacterium]